MKRTAIRTAKRPTKTSTRAPKYVYFFAAGKAEGSSALLDLLSQSREECRHTPGRPTRSHEDHRRILEASKPRDEVAAHRAMLDHLIAVETLVTGVRGEEARPPVASKRKAP